ncbi:MAG: hypothetical protein SFY32_00765 [Bacteroidota bacterium]|nr:hypothetical protein [Bacteroidota bacterium]
MNTTIELRTLAINKIAKIEDHKLLKEINLLLDIDLGAEDLIKLDSKHKEAVLLGITQIEKGDFLKSEEANKKVDEWLKK